MEIYPYIPEAVESITTYFKRHRTGNPLLAMPTGTGKSLVIAFFLKEVVQQYPKLRVLALTHQKELIEQNFLEHIGIWPESPCGIYAASLKRKETHYNITFGSIQSLFRCWELLGRIDLIIIDEAHLVSPKDETMYKWLITGLLQQAPHLRIIGLSATCWRLGHGMLTDNHIFTDICYNLTTFEKFNWLIDEGYLAPLRPVRTTEFYNLEGINTVQGDYNQNQLQSRFDRTDINIRVLNEICIKAAPRKHWLIFATGIEHCEHVAELLNSEYGISARAVHSKLSTELRDRYFREFKRGDIRCLVNKNLATTGFNFRPLDFIGAMYPTQSSSLWVQMLGRGTRVSPGKQDCLVMDFARNTERLGPINDPVIPRPPSEKKRQGPPPIKICPTCSSYLHTSTRYCDTCGHEFPAHEVQLTQQASELELIRRNEKPEPKLVKCFVRHVTFSPHTRPGKPVSVKVTYYCNQGATIFHQYLGFEHVPFIRRRAVHWWNNLQAGSEPVPTTIVEALKRTNELNKIRNIVVNVADKYPEIVNIECETKDRTIYFFYCDPDYVHSTESKS